MEIKIRDYMSGKYTAPSFQTDAFHCPHCGVFAHQLWYTGDMYDDQNRDAGEIDNLYICVCQKCGMYSLWVDEKIIYPASSIAPLPSEDMPTNVEEDFVEARNIVNASPRGAAALLRLAVQKLMPHLGESGKDLNDDIANLVKKGLPEKIQKSLDSVRVIGNNAVHPGEIDLKDDADTAIALFELLNMIVDVMITQPKRVDKIYGKIPSGAKEAIRKRDKKT